MAFHTYVVLTASFVTKYEKSPEAASLSPEVAELISYDIHSVSLAATEPRTAGGVSVVA